MDAHRLFGFKVEHQADGIIRIDVHGLHEVAWQISADWQG